MKIILSPEAKTVVGIIGIGINILQTATTILMIAIWLSFIVDGQFDKLWYSLITFKSSLLVIGTLIMSISLLQLSIFLYKVTTKHISIQWSNNEKSPSTFNGDILHD